MYSAKDDTGDVYLPFLSLDAIYGVDQVVLDQEDDDVSDTITVSGFPFGSSTQTQLYVSNALNYNSYYVYITHNCWVSS